MSQIILEQTIEPVKSITKMLHLVLTLFCLFHNLIISKFTKMKVVYFVIRIFLWGLAAFQYSFALKLCTHYYFSVIYSKRMAFYPNIFLFNKSFRRQNLYDNTPKLESPSLFKYEIILYNIVLQIKKQNL